MDTEQLEQGGTVLLQCSTKQDMEQRSRVEQHFCPTAPEKEMGQPGQLGARLYQLFHLFHHFRSGTNETHETA